MNKKITTNVQDNRNRINIKSFEVEEVLNKETGEVEEKKVKKSYTIKKEDNYIKLYIKHINYLNNLPGGLDPLIYELVLKTNYGNQIVINSAIKREIATKIGKDFKTINQYITKLVKLDILIRVDTGVYYLNPEFYGKGNWEDILELRQTLELSVTYENDKYTIIHNGIKPKPKEKKK